MADHQQLDRIDMGLLNLSLNIVNHERKGIIMSRKNRIESLSPDEKVILEKNRDKIHRALAKEPEKLREHLQAFNDGVMAIIITIIVLEIKPPLSPNNYPHFIGDIIIFLISFFVIADFWYDLHLDFSYLIFEPGKATAIVDFLLLADLSLLPIMTKWVMEEPSSFAVANFGIVFLIAKILRIIEQYVGTMPTMRDYKIINTLMTRSSLRKMMAAIGLNIFLIALSLFIPRVAMILYLVIPIISFIFPLENKANKYRKNRVN